MTNHWALIVGINQYQSLQPLSFAQRDAQALQTCLVTEGGLMPERCILLTEVSPPAWERATYPSRDNLTTWFNLLSEEFIQPGDWVWVFFSGYGVCWQGQDYLLPIEADPTALERTAIPLRWLFERLKAAPTDRILLLLDMNRSQAIISGERVGVQTAELAKEFGVPTILASQPDQFSQEAPDLGQGLFTAALLESLRFQKASPLENLERYLSTRLPELSEHHYRPLQHPLISLGSPDQLQQETLPSGDSLECPEWDSTTHQVAVDGKPADSTPAEVDDPWHLPEPDYADSEPAIAASPAENPFATQPLGNLAGPSGRPGRSTPPVADEVASEDTEDMPDPAFWQRFLWGIGVVMSVLIFGVLIRNLLGGQQQTAQQPAPPPTGEIKPLPDQSPAPKSPTAAPLNAPTATKSPSAGSPAPKSPGTAKPSEKPVAQAPTKPSPKPPVLAPESPKVTAPAPVAAKPGAEGDLLTQARALIKPSLASEASRAIAIARKIPPTDPQYAQAQQEIDRWSQDILDIANQRAAQRDFKQAINAAQLVPDDRPQVYAEAQKLIAQWKKKR
jgi:Caspase domain